MNKPALFYFSTLWIATTTLGLAASSQDNEVLDRSYRMQLEYRQGKPDVVNAESSEIQVSERQAKHVRELLQI